MSTPAVSKGFPIGLRVLVVDDDPLCLKIVEKMLKRCQYEGACLARHMRPVIVNLPIGTRISLGTRGVETAMERLTSDRIAAGSALKRCIRVFQKYLARFPNRPALAAWLRWALPGLAWPCLASPGSACRLSWPLSALPAPPRQPSIDPLADEPPSLDSTTQSPPSRAVPRR